MVETKQNMTKISRQIWLPRDVVSNLKTQKASDQRPPRQQPTLHDAFVAMFEMGLDLYESKKIAWNPQPRNTSDPGYYVISFPGESYTRAEQIAAVEGLTILDVIVGMIQIAHENDFKLSNL